MGKGTVLGLFGATPPRALSGEEARTRLDQRDAILGRDPANRHAGYLEQAAPPGKQFGIGPMLAGLGSGRKKRAKSDIVGSRFARFHREMAAGVAGDADLRLWPQLRARVSRVARSEEHTSELPSLM